MSTRIITIASHKGGTGKTTTTITLGHGLAREGERVLLIDLDSQGAIADFLGLRPQPGLTHLLLDGAEPIQGARENLDVIASDRETADLKVYLSSKSFREQVLLHALERIGGYDWILFDTAPSLDVLQVAAFVASESVLVPVQLEYAAVTGCRRVLHSLDEVREAGYSVGITGVLPTFCDRRTTESAANLEVLEAHFPELLWEPIPIDVNLPKAQAHGQSIWEFAPRTRSIVGMEVEGRLIGGYAKALERLMTDEKT